MSDLLKPGDLSPGERLLLWRRRAELTWYESAKRFDVTIKKYRMWEEDRLSDGPEIPRLRKVQDHEACYLLRRRTGLHQDQLAEEVGVSRVWLNRMENGQENCSRLVDYWRGGALNG